MKTAITYRRVSTDKQAEKYSLPAQKKINLETAQKLECTIIKEYEDPGCSAGSLETMPDLKKLLRELDETQPQALIVTDIDRLGRGYDFFLVLKELLARDISIFTENGQESELVTGFRALIGLEERKAMVKRTRRGKEEAAQKGKWHGGPIPYGYKFKKGRLIPHPQEQEVVKQIFSWAKEGYGFWSIARLLNARGIPTKKGKSWYYPGLRTLLRNRIYVGEIYHQGTWYKGEHRPILSKRKFEAVQRILDGRKAEEVDRSHKHLFSGFVWCGRCGQRLVIHYLNRRRNYACSGYRYGTCRGVYITEARLRRVVIPALFEYTANIKVEPYPQNKSDGVPLEETKRQMGKLEREIQRLMADYYGRQALRPQDYWNRYHQLIERQELLEKELKGLEWGISREREALIERVKHINVQEVWDYMEIEDRRQIFKLFIEKIIVEPDPERILGDKRIRIIWKYM